MAAFLVSWDLCMFPGVREGGSRRPGGEVSWDGMNRTSVLRWSKCVPVLVRVVAQLEMTMEAAEQ